MLKKNEGMCENCETCTSCLLLLLSVYLNSREPDQVECNEGRSKILSDKVVFVCSDWTNFSAWGRIQTSIWLAFISSFFLFLFFVQMLGVFFVILVVVMFLISFRRPIRVHSNQYSKAEQHCRLKWCCRPAFPVASGWIDHCQSCKVKIVKSKSGKVILIMFFLSLGVSITLFSFFTL